MSDQPQQPQQPVQPEQAAPPSIEAQQPAPQQAMPHATEPQAPHTPHTQQPVDQREWVAVAPPHPYAARQSEPAGKGLAIAAMALGLAALLTVVVAAFYHGVYAWLGVVLGVIAIVLGIVALVKRQRPLAASIVGIGGGGIATLAGLFVTALVLIALVLPGGYASGDGGGTPGTDWTPETQPEALIQWPANMITGGIIFEGSGDASTGSAVPRPVPSPQPQPGTSPLQHEVDRDRLADVILYVDYRCPHCLAFEQANSEFLEQIVASGSATVEIVPLSFMDRASDGAYYSSRAAGAIACLADSQPEAAWRGHNVLLSPSVQPGQGPGLTNDEIIEAIDEAVGGLSPAARGCIESERFVTFAQALNDWVFANPVPNANDQEARLQGTPSVFVNGEFYDGGSDDAEAFEAFFERQTS